MKKKIALFLFLLINAVGLNAQGLDGSWKTTFSKNDFSADMYFTFAQDSLNMRIKSEKSQQGLGAVDISVYIPLKYNRSGDNLQLIGDGEGISVNIDNLKLDDKQSKSPEEIQAIKESVKTHMQEKIQASKGEFLKEIIKEDAFTIKSLTDSELIIADNSGQVLVFKKCK